MYIWTKFILPLFAASISIVFIMTAYADELENKSMASSSDASYDVTDTTYHTGSGMVLPDKQEREDIDKASPSDLTIDEITTFSNDDTYKFSIKKIGEEGILNGAVFRLYRTLDDAYDDWDPILFEFGDDQHYIACFSYDSPGYDLTSDIMAGTAYIEGLPVGIYYLAEIATPIGYQKLHYPIQIKLNTDETVYYVEVMSGEELTEAPGGEIIIGNYAKVLMPGTGGPGKYLIYVLGTICILTALVMGFRLKKRGDG